MIRYHHIALLGSLLLAACNTTGQNSPDITTPAMDQAAFDQYVVTGLRDAANAPQASYVDEFQRRSRREAEAALAQSYSAWHRHDRQARALPGYVAPARSGTVSLPEFVYQCTFGRAIAIARFNDYHQIVSSTANSHVDTVNRAFDELVKPILNLGFLNRLENNTRILSVDQHPAMGCMSDLVTHIHAAKQNNALDLLPVYDKLTLIIIATHNMAVLRDVAINHALETEDDAERVYNIMDGYMVRFHQEAHALLPTALQDKVTLKLLNEHGLDADRRWLDIIEADAPAPRPHTHPHPHHTASAMRASHRHLKAA